MGKLPRVPQLGDGLIAFKVDNPLPDTVLPATTVLTGTVTIPAT